VENVSPLYAKKRMPERENTKKYSGNKRRNIRNEKEKMRKKEKLISI